MRTDLSSLLGSVKWDMIPLWSVAPRVDNKNRGLSETNLLSLSYGRVIRKDIDAIGGLRPESYETYNIIEAFDVVLRMTDLQNDQRSIRTGQTFERGLITSAYITVRPDQRKVEPRFLAAVLRAYDIHKTFYKMGAGVRQNLSYSELADIPIPFPDRQTQLRIADYLDQETGEADAMIEKLEALAQELRLRRNLIYLNVVKRVGVRRAPMWAMVSKVASRNVGLTETNLLSLSYGNLVRKSMKSAGGLRPESYETYNVIEPDDIVLRMTDLQNDQKSIRTGIALERGIITSAYITVRPDPKKVEPRYLAAVLRAYDIQKAFYEMGAGVRQNLGYNELAHLEIPLVGSDEQKRLADHLDEATGKIDVMLAKVAELKSLLTERRAALITEVVTGRKDVA